MNAKSPTRRNVQWEIAEHDSAAISLLVRETGLSPVTVSILMGRDLASAETVRRFLEPSLDCDWVADDTIPGMSEAAVRVADAVREGARIVVFGDFDLDGISSAALTALGLREMGAVADAIVPHRFREGYGLTPEAMERVIEHAPDLVITVDCGISSANEVAWLKERGIDVVVTDHHEPGEDVPSGVPVANPKLAPDGGVPLAGAGVALELVRTAGTLLGHGTVWRRLTDLAALGTIADIVPLVGANRALVADGIECCRRQARPGVEALAQAAKIPVGSLRSDQVGFGLAPRLNAAGRMADPDLALELLMTSDSERAAELASVLDAHNRERQTVEGELLAAALDVAAHDFTPGDRVLVVAGEGWHEGVRGIVASRLVSRFGVPALVFCIDNGEAQGSGRSIPGVDLYAMITDCVPLLTRFGGHEMAVGVTLPAADLGRLREHLASSLAALPEEVFTRVLAIDAEVQLESVSRELAEEMALLEPFGCANPRPLLAARGVFMKKRSLVGKTNDHLAFTAYDGVVSAQGIAFRCQNAEMLVEHDAAVDLAFELECSQWRGTRSVRLLARDIAVHSVSANAPAAELVDDLFAHADEILARNTYQGLEDAGQFNTKLAGVTFGERQGHIERLSPGSSLRIVREADNPHDEYACALFDIFGSRIGYFNRRLAAVLAPVLDAGVQYDVEVTAITGGGEGESYGVNVLVTRRGEGESNGDALAAAAARRAELASLGIESLTRELIRHFIGEHQPHMAQVEALAHLAAGRSTLVVMATGRGKSLIFHVHAAREAILGGRASVFIYPLRALVADQAFHLEEQFAEIGCSVATLTGESPSVRRDEIFAALAEGSLDVVLTTPEFLECHSGRFAAGNRVGFVVVDEAHHAGMTQSGYRPAYRRLGSTVASIAGTPPTVLAVTATAPDDVADAIRAGLGITAEVIDPATRENLRIVDRRNPKDKDALVAGLVARGEKVIVYVNSRERTVRLARKLRARVPGRRHHVAYYNAAMTRDARHAVERAFRDGDLSAVVSTTAFGEGVNIPDVRHVVLYHVPMGDLEFNQLCGRCGRDGEPAFVHLAFGEQDAQLNRMILSSSAPSREELAALYLVLRDLAAEYGGEIEITNAELAERATKRRQGVHLNEKGVSAGLGVFRELDLVRSEGAGAYRQLLVPPAPEIKLDLASSIRYTEGLREIAGFEAFLSRALTATPEELLSAFNRPILPTRRLKTGSVESGACV